MAHPRTLPDALAEAARADAGFIFVSDGGDTLRSYAEIRAAAVRVAASLREAGLQRGDLVALVMSRGWALKELHQVGMSLEEVFIRVVAGEEAQGQAAPAEAEIAPAEEG